MTLFSRDIFTEIPAIRRLGCLFNDAVSGSDCATSNDKMSKEWRIRGTMELISLAIVHELSYNFAFVIRSSFKNFPEFAVIIYRSCCMREISAHWHPSSPYGCHQMETFRKRENQQLVSLSRQRFSTPVGFGQGFLSKEQCDNVEAFSILSCSGCSWFLPLLSTEISSERAELLWCYWHH